MIEVALTHGFAYSRDCDCASPGRIYIKGRNRLTIYTQQPRFLLVRIGNNKTAGNAEDLETTLTTFGL